jgi:hypothetical protein
MQCNFSYEIAEDIFIIDQDHLWDKWIRSRTNIINFLSSLDQVNQQKMMNWGETLAQE